MMDRIGRSDDRAEPTQGFQFSDLEAWILETIDNIGWYAYLWFPVVHREVLNFGDDSSDEEIYAAFASLVKRNALVPSGIVKWDGANIPQWKPRPDALAIAKGILHSKFGWPDSYKPPAKPPDPVGE